MAKNKLNAADVSSVAGGAQKGTNLISAKTTEGIATVIAFVRGILVSTLSDKDAEIADKIIDAAQNRITNKVMGDKGMNASTLVKIFVETLCEAMNTIPGIPTKVSRIFNKNNLMPIVKQGINMALGSK